MINLYYHHQNRLVKTSAGEQLDDVQLDELLWVDLFDATATEKASVERTLGIELFTQQESEEIESSSKYAEDANEIGINLNFLHREKGTDIYEQEAVSFILRKNTLITQRNFKFKTFRDTERKVFSLRPRSGADVLLYLFEVRIDVDADLIEHITEQITQVSRTLTRKDNLNEDVLLKITNLQETTIAIRENIIEKQRIISSILKSDFFPKDNLEKIRIMIKDIGSLLDHTSFNFERLEFLQNTFLGLIDIEQNRVIKIFTVVTVVFMPPTLIASMYGMNFHFMPELDEVWGYPFAILLMVLSSAFTLLFFKRKNWL